MTTNEQELLHSITVDPRIFGGKPIVRGMRISVETVLSLLAQGEPSRRYSPITRGLRARMYRLASRMRMP